MTRGEYLVRAGGCFSCHTAAGGQKLAGGRALATPFGTFYSPNITPDPETGIGRWTDAQFLRALREGVRPDGANYFPVFPYPSFTGITDSDALAIKDLSLFAPGGAPAEPATRRAFPVFLALPANRLETIVLYPGPVPARTRPRTPLIIEELTSSPRSPIAANATPRAISSAPRDPASGWPGPRMGRTASSFPTSRRIRAPGSASGKRVTLSSC